MFLRFRSELGEEKKKRSREAGKCVSGFEYQITLARTLHHAAPELDLFSRFESFVDSGSAPTCVRRAGFVCMFAEHMVFFCAGRKIWILFVRK